jgi:hypothetical protein
MKRTQDKNQNAAPPDGPIYDWLSPEEIERLRQRAKERSAFFQKTFAHPRPKAK